ncbi:FUSC family membrane protein [Flavobacterium sp. RHBU_3]|uniref:FUSC family protein n=1 Tax=Flavobacterium sp. RHBU_3 TaxID=3391184 RepID=UPI00398471CA
MYLCIYTYMIQRVRLFTENAYFTRALIVTVSAVLPVLVLKQFGHFEVGFTIALGAFLTYPSDIPSNWQQRVKGLCTAAAIISGSTLLVNILHPLPWLFYPVITALIFFLSMISVYGQRATMVSFSGLLAIALGTGHIQQGPEVFIYAGEVLAGSLFYTLLSLTFNYLNPHRYSELQIADCLKLTAKYMKLRGDLWDANAERESIISKQLHLQVDINTTHDNLREILIRSHSSAGTNNKSRRMLMVFISLMEILELGLSTPFDHSKMYEKFGKDSKVLAIYQKLAYDMAATLKRLGKNLENHKQYLPKNDLSKNLEALSLAISEYETGTSNNDDAEGVWMLLNVLHYAEKQIEKIKFIERVFAQNLSFKEMPEQRRRDLEKFLTPENYMLSTLRENLTFSSTIFRHSLRLTLTIAIGFIIGNLFPFQNIYWILLTIVVIMRPGYGLTKQRSYQRIVGTVAGGIIAFALLYFIHSPEIIGTLSIICMLLGFTFTAINYSIGATFVTIYVILLYSLLTPNINGVIQYRFIDTAVGAVLAFIANYFFWPSWEFISLPKYIKSAIEANRDYLIEISRFYNNKGDVTTGYRLARKNAFVSLGNLMQSYQRMAQEPKSKQKQQQQIYKIAVLNHTMLSSLASMGTYIQSHKTTSASKAFNVVVETIIKNLEHAVSLMDMENRIETALLNNNDELAMRFTELKNIRAEELKELELTNEQEFRLRMEEAQLVIEQLVWLNSLSERIVKAVKNLETVK